MKSPPLDKVEIIERSMRCFSCGLAGVFPVLGLPFAIVSIADCVRVIRRKGANWNPAERYLRWGVACAAFGLLMTLLLAAALVIQFSGPGYSE
jgi:hypothetical protein